VSAPPIRHLEPVGLGRTHRLKPEPVPVYKRRKVAGKFALVVLLSLSVITGSLAGLTLVFSVDLPQINDLERYRPSTTTDLYDAKGRVIGSFALERRVIVNYNDFAPILREAVISIEDKNFDSHWGINVFRIAGALWHDLRAKGRFQGASTLTMQLAKSLFLTQERTWRRKLPEIMITLQLEQKLSKEEIFEYYCNQIYLGYRGSFRIRGFGEASELLGGWLQSFVANGKTVLMATHDLEQGLQGARRWAFIDQGRIAEELQGTDADIRDQYKKFLKEKRRDVL